MSEFKQKGATTQIPGSEVCGVCGEQSVIRQGDGNRYCYRHLTEYLKGKQFEQINAEFMAEKSMAAKEAKR
jgi:hypothetical protein